VSHKITSLVHLANFNSTNIGNGALIFGTERVLREDWGKELEFLPEPWDDYTFGLKTFDANFVSSINAADGLIVGGAVTLNGRDYLTNAGMRFDLPYDLWKTFSKPIVFYGISYRVWPGQPYHHLDKFKRALDYMLNSSRIMFSVRNDGTKPWLESLIGYKSEKIEVIPDPALYVPVKDSWHPELMQDRVNILVALNNEDEQHRFHGGKSEKENYLKQLVHALEMLSQEWDLNIILCPHYFDDYKIMSEFISLFPPRLAHQRTISTGLLKVPRTEYFYDLYAKADLALSMRIHSMSPAIGLGTPMVALSSQGRMSEFLNIAGLPEFMLDIFESDLAEKLHAKINYVLRRRDEVRLKFKTARSAMRVQTKSYNQKVAALISTTNDL
jgi:polysaccharide pyruvyl transferase WcaK-like protein